MPMQNKNHGFLKSIPGKENLIQRKCVFEEHLQYLSNNQL
jgi:hypothetical protein